MARRLAVELGGNWRSSKSGPFDVSQDTRRSEPFGYALVAVNSH